MQSTVVIYCVFTFSESTCAVWVDNWINILDLKKELHVSHLCLLIYFITIHKVTIHFLKLSKYCVTVKIIIKKKLFTFSHFIYVHKIFCSDRFSFPDFPSMSDKVAIVTGGSRGIGVMIVKKLLQCDMEVIIGEPYR